MNPEPLKRLVRATRRNVREFAAFPGAAHVVLRQGRCVLATAEGVSRCRPAVPFTLRTLCPLHGASKPLIVAAFLTLVEEGRVKLSDPISKHLKFPESRITGKTQRMQKVKTQATLRHLLTMTAGIGYDTSPFYRQTLAKVKQRKVRDLAAFYDAIVAAPLLYEPGTRYLYSFSTDLLGRVCEAISGQDIHHFLRTRLLQPLGMVDTHFAQKVPKSKQQRLMVLYNVVRRGKGTSCKGSAQKHFRFEKYDTDLCAPDIPSCGGGILSYKDVGIVSSIQDYAKFCHMLVNNGKASTGHQVLRPATVRALWTDGLASYQDKTGRLAGWNDCEGRQGYRHWDYVSWSLLNTHLVHSHGARKGPARRGHVMWMGGGGGAYWSIDAKRKTVALSFVPCFGSRQDDSDGLGPVPNDASLAAKESVDTFALSKRRRQL